MTYKPQDYVKITLLHHQTYYGKIINGFKECPPETHNCALYDKDWKWVGFAQVNEAHMIHCPEDELLPEKKLLEQLP